VQSALIGAYPVGSIYMNAAVATNPATLLGFGTWVAFGAGKVPVGIDAADSDFNTVGGTGGTKDAIVPTHTHTASSSSTSTDSGHTHSISRGYGASGTGGDALLAGGGVQSGSATANITTLTTTTIANAGESATGKNLQPYIVVYMWKRTA
jgi:microcystin-dependent protein